MTGCLLVSMTGYVGTCDRVFTCVNDWLGGYM